MSKVGNFLSTATSKVASGFKKASVMGTAAMCAVEAGMINAFAETTTAEIVAEPELNNLMQEILKIIFTIFRYVGILLLVWAIIQIVMAFKNDDADSKQKGMVLAVIAVVLTVMSSVMVPLLKLLGFNQ